MSDAIDGDGSLCNIGSQHHFAGPRGSGGKGFELLVLREGSKDGADLQRLP